MNTRTRSSETDQSLWLALARAICGKKTDLAEFSGQSLLRAINQHGVGQLLSRQIKAGVVTGVDEETKGQLVSADYKAAAFDMLLNTATTDLLDLLAENEIPALLLKGTPVAHLYYPDSYLRPRCDTDIYINEHDLEKITELLASNDYQLSGLGKRTYSSKQFVAAIATSRDSFLHFDMHWKLSNRVMFRPTLPFAECLEDSQPVPVLGPHAGSLSKRNLLIHACIHRIAHGRNTERDRLLWLYDIHLITETMADIELGEFLHTAQEKEVAALCADAFEVCQVIFGTSLPDGYVQELKGRGKKERSAKLINSSKLRWAWADMHALEKLGDKVTFAFELLRGSFTKT